MLAEPLERIKRAITFSDEPPEEVPLVSHIFARENAESISARDDFKVQASSLQLFQPQSAAVLLACWYRKVATGLRPQSCAECARQS